MTSGSRIWGTKVFNNQPSNLYQEKTWSGADDPEKKRDNAYTLFYEYYKRINAYSINTAWPFDPPFLYAGTNYNVNTPTIKGVSGEPLAELRALGKVRAAIKEHDFNAAGAFADTEKTLEMLVNAIKQCFRFLAAVQRLDIVELSRLVPAIIMGSPSKKGSLAHALRTRDVAGCWLALQYGWSPLIADVVAGVEAFKQRHEPLRSMKFTGRATSPIRTVSVGVDPNAVVNAVLFETVSYVVTLREVPSIWKTLAANALLTVVWERIPFSFVADWFIPIGNMLEEFQFFSGLDLSYCKTSKKVFVVNQAIHAYAPGPPLYQHGWIPGWLQAKYVRLDRTVGTSLDVPLPSFKSMEKAFSSAHCKNAAALIVVFVSAFNAERTERPRNIKRNRVVSQNIGKVGKWQGTGI